MRKRWKKILVVAAVFAMVMAVGTTLAFMFKRTSVKNHFVPATVTCKVHEKLDGNEHSDGIHMGNRKSEIHVENTGNYNAYIRVRIVSYWVDADGNTIGMPAQIPKPELANEKWLSGENDTYYYETPVAPGELTEMLFKPFMLQTSVDAKGATVYQMVEVLAEAIQAEPAAAAEESWGVTVTDGKITNAP